MEPQRCQHCAGRPPHEFARGIVSIRIDGRGKLASDRFSAVHHCFDEKDAGIAS
jgi:hypothetical protein